MVKTEGQIHRRSTVVHTHTHTHSFTVTAVSTSEAVKIEGLMNCDDRQNSVMFSKRDFVN